MIVELGKEGNHFALHMQGGWVTREICERLEIARAADCWNFHSIGGRISNNGALGNEIKLIFSINATREDCQEFVDYLNMIFRDVIPSAFVGISVSPYDIPDYDDVGAMVILREIHKETGCTVDWGDWNKPVVFTPHDNLQYNRVIDLLLEFKMVFHNWDYKGGQRD